MISTKKLAYKICQKIATIDASIASMVDTFYPVGSYYETSDTSFDPNVSWGGTWSLESAGKVHISAGTGYVAGSTGGSATHTHTTGNHTLTISEIPTHQHQIALKGMSGGLDYGLTFTASGVNGAMWGGNYVEYVGGGGAHNHGNTGSSSNLPPYIVVNRWHRTA